MNKGISIGIIALFIITAVSPMVIGYDIEITEKVEPESIVGGNTLYVGGSGPGNYSRIQDAIDNASDGDTVFVYDDSSPYYGHVMVDKSISFIGENRDTTIIDDAYVEIIADHVKITKFTIRNGVGIYLRSSNSTTVDSNAVISGQYNGICLMDSHSCTIVENQVIYNGDFEQATGLGILLSNSYNNAITHNNISSNGLCGVHVYNSSNNTMSCNYIFNDTNGIQIWKSSNNTVFENTISNNINIGIDINVGSSDNTIYHNNFINNGPDTRQARDISGLMNIWDDGYPSGGNYWDDYTGTDGDGDGIGDTPYNINVNNTDSYPLMNRWNGFHDTKENGQETGNGTPGFEIIAVLFAIALVFLLKKQL